MWGRNLGEQEAGRQDALAGLHRDLADLRAQQTQELTHAQAQAEAAGAPLDALTDD